MPIDQATVRLNVWRWRREQNKRAVKIEVRKRAQQPADETPPTVQGTALEIMAVRREATGFRNGMEGL